MRINNKNINVYFWGAQQQCNITDQCSYTRDTKVCKNILQNLDNSNNHYRLVQNERIYDIIRITK